MKAAWFVLAALLLGTPAMAQTDMIPVGQIQFVGPGGDIGAQRVTTAITAVDVRSNGVEVTFSKREGAGRWPDNTTPGWSGPLQYSLGIVERIGSQWVASAPIETWFGNNIIGGAIQDSNVTCAAGFRGQVACNWFYDARWTPLTGVQPAAGSTIGVFVVAGDARNDFMPVGERSNIVTITMPAAGQTAHFDFLDEPQPIPVPQPVPQPTPTPTPAPLPSTDLSPVLNAVGIANTQIVLLRQELAAHIAQEEAHWAVVSSKWKEVVGVVSPVISALLIWLKAAK